MNNNEALFEAVDEGYVRLVALDSLKHSYKLLTEDNNAGSRISPLLPLSVDGCELAASIVEREYIGSESYAIFIYELVNKTEEGAIAKKILLSGGEKSVKLVDLIFAETKNIAKLSTVCAMIEAALEEKLCSQYIS